MHGGADEPNLIPLLDLILQLVMFFMACTSFAKENISEAVRLPLAQSAKPIEDDELKANELVYLNVEENGDMRIRPFIDENGTQWYVKGKIDDVVANDVGEPVPGPDGKAQHDAKVRRDRIEKFFQRVFDNRSKRIKRDLGPGGGDEGTVRQEVAKKTLVVLRAHQNCDYRDVYDILNKARSAGFSKMQLRATMDTKAPQ